MKIYSQTEKHVFRPDSDIHYALLSSYLGTKFPHRHDFYEIFLSLQGMQEAVLNGRTIAVKPGTLLLMRPGDIHSRSYLTPGNHINVAFSARVARLMFDYLEDEHLSKKLLDDSFPPCIYLDSKELAACRQRLEELNVVDLDKPKQLRTKFRILIMDFFTRYFFYYSNTHAKSKEPHLFIALHEMEKPENLMIGLPILLELTGWSHEHLCRIFQTELSCTPTSYINSLRLNYAANSLLHSDLCITDICYNSGFGNLSHFHHLFKRRYGCTPLHFRKERQPQVIYHKGYDILDGNNM